MEYAQATIRLAGSLLNTVEKEVSAPEIAILRAVHGGQDTVVNIKLTRTDNISSKDERNRLEFIYNKELIEKLYPGVMGKLPLTLAEVGVESEDATAKEAKAKK